MENTHVSRKEELMAQAKTKEQLETIARKIVDQLCDEGLMVWQAKEALRLAADIMDWLPIKKAVTEVTACRD